VILRVLDTGLMPARRNAAMSAALLAAVDAGAPATLRFHRYPLSCILGRNQDADVELDLAACRTAGIEIARRVTGGGAVAMGPGVLAFDLVMPATMRQAGGIRGSIGEAFVDVLAGLGVAAKLATPGSIEIGGRKVSGSAGRLGRRALLHQATLILDLSRTAPLALLRRRTEGGRPTPDPRHRVTDLRQALLVPRAPSPLAGEGGLRVSEGRMRGRDSTVREASHPSSVTASRRHLLPQGEKEWECGVQSDLTRAFAAAFGLTPEPALPSAAEHALAEDILAREIGRDDYTFNGASCMEAAA